MPKTINRSQTINFLGFLRGQLSGLQGIPTLCYELIQNADDVKNQDGNAGASKIIFDVCEDALYVYNDGVFRDIDFERMEKVSWGNKREEEGTTGAFGLGFISVYQVTDSPEIISSGRHWRFVPNGAENERIRETQLKTKETKFRLPWAFEESDVRKELGIPPVKTDSLDDIVKEINGAIESAALFLKQVTVLELQRQGKTVRKIETYRENNKLLLVDGTQTIVWRILEGRFDEEAKDLRGRFKEIIERKRQPLVKLAIPDKPDLEGLLYAFLPSEMTTGLPFHINSDFYPSSDRKRIIFDETYKSEWDQAAIACAAATLAENFNVILEIFTERNQAFWEFADRVKKASENNGVCPEFTLFWEYLKPRIVTTKTVLTSSGDVVYPSDVLYLDTRELIKAEKIFENLGMKIAHAELRSKQNLLLETGVQKLTLKDIFRAFLANGLDKRVEMTEMPEGLKSLAGWQIFWEAVTHLWNRSYTNDRQESEDLLKRIAIAPGSDDALWPPEKLFRAEPTARKFFSKICQPVWFEERMDTLPLPGQLVPQFGVQDGLNLLKEAAIILPELWKEGVFSPKEMLGWFLENQSKLNLDHVQQMKKLAIWPSAEGELKLLTELYLAGDFEDPLGLAQLINLEELGGGRDFFEQKIKIAKLDFQTYVREWVPSVIERRRLSSETIFALVRVLATHIGRLRDYPKIREILSELPIVWCGEEEFNPAAIVWFDTEVVREVLGDEVKMAKLPAENPESIRQLYLWIGVSPEPEPKDIVWRVKQIVQGPPDLERRIQIEEVVGFVAKKWNDWSGIEKAELEMLRGLKWLPGTKSEEEWFDPKNVYSIYSQFLFASQGNFLDVERKIQQNASDFFKYLGIESEPKTELVVRHLLYCSEQKEPISTEIYVNLSRNFEDPSIKWLRGKKCLYLKNPVGGDGYYTPDQVFWNPHSFGKHRFRLSSDYARFRSLFDKIGVKESPEVEDAIKVLLEISDEYEANKNLFTIVPGEEDVLIMCWKLISEALENEKISHKEIKNKLGNHKTIPDHRKLLIKPSMMFFEDRPGWGEKFSVVENNLTPRIEGVWLGMEAAGIRPLSSVVETTLTECTGHVEDQELTKLVHERWNLLQRVIEENRKKSTVDLDIHILDDLTFEEAERIEIKRVFHGFGKKQEAPLEEVDAIYIDNCLFFVINNDHYPWKGIARELSFVIDETGESRSLAMEIKEILSQSYEEAKSTLDELGYPEVETAEIEIAEGATLNLADDIADDDSDIESIRVSIDHLGLGEDTKTRDKEAGNGGKEEVEKTGSGKSSGKSDFSGENPKIEKRRKSRLQSYVYPEDATSSREEDPNLAQRRNALGDKGVQLVMQYERDQGRIPKDMDKIQVHHPGYDVESSNGSKEVRYIEVKSLSGLWDGLSPARLTKTEFENAKKKGENFWLYVVEKAETEDFQIYLIQNPANRVDYYLFDHGWIVEQDEVGKG